MGMKRVFYIDDNDAYGGEVEVSRSDDYVRLYQGSDVLLVRLAVVQDLIDALRELQG